MFQSLILGFVAIAAAAPVPGDSSSSSSNKGQGDFDKNKGVDYFANFDDLTPVIGAVAAQEVGPYDGLDYVGIDLVSPGVDGVVVAGVVPNTLPNVGVYGQATQDILEDSPLITTNYTGSVSESFDFHEFYFGCEEGTVEVVASTLAACNVTVSGYKGDKFVGNQTFYYTADLLTDGLTSAMVKAKLDPRRFQGITTATFSSDIVNIDLATVTLIDSLKYTVYYKEGKGPQDANWKGADGYGKEKESSSVLDTSSLTKPVTDVTSQLDFDGLANSLGLGELTTRGTSART